MRSALWPIAIMSIIHRSYVLTSNGYITDDWAPVYWAAAPLPRRRDIYNEHFDQVDPHYLYPPGGTLLMAPFGYIDSDVRRAQLVHRSQHAWPSSPRPACWCGCSTSRCTSVALPALLAAIFVTESVTNTLVFTNINGCILLCEVLFFRWLLDGRLSHQWLAGIAIGLSLVVKPVLAVLLLLPLLNRQWRALVDRGGRAFGVQRAGLAAGGRPRRTSFTGRCPTSCPPGTTSTPRCWATASTTGCRCG